jgi:hypothetical protein
VSRRGDRGKRPYLRGAVGGASFVLLVVALGGCPTRQVAEPKIPQNPVPETQPPHTAPLASRLGWLHGPCLAIKNADLKEGTPITIVVTATPQTVRSGRLGARTRSAAACPGLAKERADVNEEGTSFYVVADGIAPGDAGIGVVASAGWPRIVAGAARIDLDGDGREELFTSCSTSEGMQFQVWSEIPYRGEPRWTGYEYLAYDVEPSCP